MTVLTAQTCPLWCVLEQDIGMVTSGWPKNVIFNVSDTKAAQKKILTAQT